jgi:hypothetical protein
MMRYSCEIVLFNSKDLGLFRNACGSVRVNGFIDYKPGNSI